MKVASSDNKEPLIKEYSEGGLQVPQSMIYFVYMVMLIDVMAACISTPVMPYYAKSFGVPTSYIGFLYAAWSFTATVFAPMLSGMADKLGRKAVLVYCLLGAGTANVIQGLAIYAGDYGFWVFLFGRAFSGTWASIGATCNVYISDVTGEGPLREKYLGMLAMVPVVAIMTGPGIGGGLAAAFGNNFPVLVDGVMTLFSAALVSYNMVETPAFLKMKKQQEEVAKGSGDSTAAQIPPVSCVVHVLGLVTFASNVASQGNLSMYALFYDKVYKFNTLYVGFLFMGSAVFMLLTQILVVPTLRKCGLVPIQSSAFGGMIGGIATVLLGLSQFVNNVWASCSCSFLGSVGGGISMAQQGAVQASFTTVANRGKVFGTVQTYQNLGKIVGPIISTNLATSEFMGRPFVVNGGLSFLSMMLLLCVPRPKEEAKKPSGIQRKQSAYGNEWEDEHGSEEDVKAIGLYVSKLLTARHYKWVSRRAEVEALLDHALPELSTSDKESYQKSFQAADKTVGYDTSAVGV